MGKAKFLILYLLVTLVSALIIYVLYADVHPFGGIKIKHNVKEIIERGDSILNRLNINLPEKIISEDIIVNSQLLRQLQNKYGLSEANEMLRSKISGFFWQISWKDSEQVEIIVSGGEQGEEKPFNN